MSRWLRATALTCHACGAWLPRPAFCRRCGALPKPATTLAPGPRRVASEALRRRWRLSIGAAGLAAILVVVLVVTGRGWFGGSGAAHRRPFPLDEEMIAPGQGEEVETNRLFENWRASGLTVKPVIRRGKTQFYRVNGKVVRITFITASQNDRHKFTTVISGENLEFLKSENGIMVFVINRAEHVFIVPIARFAGCLGEIYLPPSGRQGYYTFTIIPGPANWMVQGLKGGVIDLAEFYGATDLFDAPADSPLLPDRSEKPMPPDAELMAPGEGALAETKRLTELWRANGWTVEPIAGQSSRGFYQVNGKTVKVVSFTSSPNNRRRTSVIALDALEILRSEAGFVVVVINRAEHVFIVPISRFTECLGESSEREGRSAYSYSVTMGPVKWKVQGTGGAGIDLAEFYGATDLLKL